MQLIGTGKQRAGKASRITIGADSLTFSSYEVNLTIEDYPTPNFESYVAANDTTYDEGVSGPLSADIRFGGDWDAGTNPLDEPPGLYPRDDLEDVQFFTNRTDAVNWDFSYIRLRSCTNGSDVRGKVTFNCSGKNQGPFTFPTGSV